MIAQIFQLCNSVGSYSVYVYVDGGNITFWWIPFFFHLIKDFKIYSCSVSNYKWVIISTSLYPQKDEVLFMSCADKMVGFQAYCQKCHILPIVFSINMLCSQ